MPQGKEVLAQGLSTPELQFSDLEWGEGSVVSRVPFLPPSLAQRGMLKPC